jgi:cation transport ATPase
MDQRRLTDVLLATSSTWTPGHGNDLLRLVAPAEHGSEHPLAAAIVQAATERGLTMAAQPSGWRQSWAQA